MARPRIAIIGSPWLRDRQTGAQIKDADGLDHEKRAKAACVELGRELARADCRLLVYSAEPHAIEPDVVKGFVKESKQRHAIEFRHPRGQGGQFPEQQLPEEPIHDQPDPREWEVSFYRSLKDADGVLLVGGRATATIAGLVATAFKRPLAVVATFDGAAATLWEDLRSVDELTDDEFHAMGREWSATSARAIVSSLLRRHEAAIERDRLAEERALELERYRAEDAARRAARPAVRATAAAFIAMLVSIVLALTGVGGKGFLWLFMTALTMAGAAGAGVRDSAGAATKDILWVMLRGSAAGFVFSMLYLAPQWLGDKGNNPWVAEQITGALRWQVLFAPILALIGGMAADSVLASLQKTGESQTLRLPGGLGGPSEGKKTPASGSTPTRRQRGPKP